MSKTIIDMGREIAAAMESGDKYIWLAHPDEKSKAEKLAAKTRFPVLLSEYVPKGDVYLMREPSFQEWEPIRNKIV